MKNAHEKILLRKNIVHPIINANDKISIEMKEQTEGYVSLQALHKKTTRALKNDREKVCFHFAQSRN